MNVEGGLKAKNARWFVIQAHPWAICKMSGYFLVEFCVLTGQPSAVKLDVTIPKE